MVGEIRDLETAEIAVQASLTGHLVMSTLHTNTAVGAVMRLVDMGVEPFLLATSLVGVLAQRLVRVLCPDCREQARADSFECQFLGIDYARAAEDLSRDGLRSCAVTAAFAVSIGIYELVVVDETLRERIHDRASEQELTRHVRKTVPRHSRRRPRQSSERRNDGSGNPARHAGGLTSDGRLRVHRPRHRRPPEEGRDRGRQRPSDPPDAARSGTRAAVGRRRHPSVPAPLRAARWRLRRGMSSARPRVVHAPDVDAARRVAAGRRSAARGCATDRKTPRQRRW